MKKFIVGILLASLFSCDRIEKADIVEIEISNNTDKTIENMYLSTIHNEAKTKEYKIDSRSIINTTLDFSNISISEGSYSINFKYIDSTNFAKKDFGYYTNGSPLDRKFFIGIYNDSVTIKSLPRDLGLY